MRSEGVSCSEPLPGVVVALDDIRWGLFRPFLLLRSHGLQKALACSLDPYPESTDQRSRVLSVCDRRVLALAYRLSVVVAGWLFSLGKGSSAT
jgi:hypothetical protein